MPERVKKAWGWTTCLHADERVELHLIEVEYGGYCSWHCHQTRDNVFVVISGILTVSLGDAEKELWSEQVGPLHKPLVVPGNEYHKFEALHGPVLAYEMYYPSAGRDTIDPEDIVRISGGGLYTPEELGEAPSGGVPIT